MIDDGVNKEELMQSKVHGGARAAAKTSPRILDEEKKVQQNTKIF